MLNREKAALGKGSFLSRLGIFLCFPRDISDPGRFITSYSAFSRKLLTVSTHHLRDIGLIPGVHCFSTQSQECPPLVVFFFKKSAYVICGSTKPQAFNLSSLWKRPSLQAPARLTTKLPCSNSARFVKLRASHVPRDQGFRKRS